MTKHWGFCLFVKVTDTASECLQISWLQRTENRFPSAYLSARLHRVFLFVCFNYYYLSICFCCCLKSFSDVIVLKQWNENEHDLSYKYPYLQTEILLTANISPRRRESKKKIKWKLIQLYAWMKKGSYLPVMAYIV